MLGVLMAYLCEEVELDPVSYFSDDVLGLKARKS